MFSSFTFSALSVFFFFMKANGRALALVPEETGPRRRCSSLCWPQSPPSPLLRHTPHATCPLSLHRPCLVPHTLSLYPHLSIIIHGRTPGSFLHLARAPHEHSRSSKCLFSLFMVSTDADVQREVEAEPPRRARAIVISGPSGVGKGCIIEQLLCQLGSRVATVCEPHLARTAERRARGPALLLQVAGGDGGGDRRRRLLRVR
jgi:hypothetical protein